MQNSVSSPRLGARPSLWSGGFRPFFLGGPAFAAVALPLWVWSLAGRGWSGTAGDPLLWHSHEMIFGYVGAVVAGFVLTAVPNWTGRLPVRGTPLAILFSLWLLGRAAVFAGALLGVAAAVIDIAFLAALAGVVWREVLAGRNARNYPICLLITGLALANLAFHVETALWGRADFAIRGGLGLIFLLITIIGGRVTPSFTRNCLAKRKAARLPAPFGVFDKACIVVTLAAMIAWTVMPAASLTAAILVLGAGLHAFRLLRWRGWDTAAEPLLLVLHVAYAWLPVSLAIMAAGRLWPTIGPSPGIHAFTAGGIGLMTLAVMTRATLGHTGRELSAGTGTVAIYLLVLVGAVLRVASPWLPVDYVTTVAAAGILWSAGFILFVLIYGPMLVGLGGRRA